MITYDITVLIGAEDSTKKALVKCNDSGVNLHVFLKTRKMLSDVRFEDTAYVIPEGTTAVLKINKVDNTFVLVDGPASTDSVFFEMPAQAFTAVGVHTAEVSLYGADGRRITSADFFIETTRECISDTSVESETYIDILAEHIKTINESAAAASASEENAEKSAQSAKKSAQSAKESAEAATASASAAATFCGSAEEAQRAAAESATKATNAANRCEDILGQVEGLEEDTETALADMSQKLFDVESTARLANDKADHLLEQTGDIETALDTIINIQNALIGGDGV